MDVNAFQVAQRFIGTKETGGSLATPLILSWLQLDNKWAEDDAVAWCSAFVNFVCFVLGLPRSRSLAARSWLLVGKSVPLTEARAGYDVVVLKRGKGVQPGPEVVAAQGHVGFYVSHDETNVSILGGNQGDAVSVAQFPKSSILRISRII
jgi:uncharacterized protein (TIGR02594 family)